MGDVDAVLAAADDAFAASLGRLCELLRFPSVATDPAWHPQCLAAARWLQATLAGMGFETSLCATGGQPVVIGTYAPEALPSHAPHILFYGHYDVQPADPLDLWESPPFEPQIRKGKDGKERIFARGASDDKGQMMTFLEATRAWLVVHGRLPFRLTLMLEGDEEGDSTHFDRLLARHCRALRPDVAWICDTGAWDAATPAIVTRLRGCICEEVTVQGPRTDLHSGRYGGAARNPIHVLASLLAGLHDARGRVTLPGFYDGVQRLPAALRREWAGLDFSPRRFLGNVGLAVPAGERGYSVIEQIWARPTAEINGIFAGYRGPGVKTVLPATATAKLSFRLVEGQDPQAIRRAFHRFVRARLPADCRASFRSDGGDSRGVAVSRESPWIKAAARALAAEWGRSPVLCGDGGSIPAVESLRQHLGIDSVLVGFARADDGAHSPNEKYDIECFRKGIRSWIRIIGEQAES
jgi:acetylornithine deacetylase/succinyl-diaminopimelate desuccinylase-like protein